MVGPMSDEEYEERLKEIMRLPPEKRINALKALEEERKRRLEEFKKSEEKERKRLEEARKLIEKTLYEAEKEEKEIRGEREKKLEETVEEEQPVKKNEKEKEEEISVSYTSNVVSNYITNLANREVYETVKGFVQRVIEGNISEEEKEELVSFKKGLEKIMKQFYERVKEEDEGNYVNRMLYLMNKIEALEKDESVNPETEGIKSVSSFYTSQYKSQSVNENYKT